MDPAVAAKDPTLFCRDAFLDNEARPIFGQLVTWARVPIRDADKMAECAGRLLTDLNICIPFVKGMAVLSGSSCVSWPGATGFMWTRSYGPQRIYGRFHLGSGRVLRGAIRNVQPDYRLHWQHRARHDRDFGEPTGTWAPITVRHSDGTLDVTVLCSEERLPQSKARRR